MRFRTTIFIERETTEVISRYLSCEPKDKSECFGENDTFSVTAQYDNGFEMDIKLCGVQFIEGESNLAWTEAVLFKNGCEVACSEPSDEFLGSWSLEYDGDVFETIIEVEGKTDDTV